MIDKELIHCPGCWCAYCSEWQCPYSEEGGAE